jgi:aminoglycoside phosphotransferase (APT) family kinase protein
LATSLRRLHRPAPPDAPANPFRGVPLRSRREVVEERLDRLELRELDSPWRRALEATPGVDVAWLHGDLHPKNVLVRDGTLAGLIDWGDVTAGDPATDLACAWMLFDAYGRSAFLEAYGPSEGEHARALGWAVNFGSAMLDSGEPRHAAIGRAIIRKVCGS